MLNVFASLFPFVSSFLHCGKKVANKLANFLFVPAWMIEKLAFFKRFCVDQHNLAVPLCQKKKNKSSGSKKRCSLKLQVSQQKFQFKNFGCPDPNYNFVCRLKTHVFRKDS